MTREEILREYEAAVVSHAVAAAAGIKGAAKSYELFKAGLDALRGPTREMVERVWNGCSDCTDPEYSVEECILSDSNSVTTIWNFCPTCGCPLTDEAVDILWRRIKEAVRND